MLEDRLKKLRKEQGYTMKELAQQLSLSESVISLYENGKRQPSYDILIKLAKLYSVTTDYLLCIDSGCNNNPKDKIHVINESIELLQKYPYTFTNDEIKQIRDFILFIKSQKNYY